MLTQLKRHRIHLVFAAITLFWFSFNTLAGVVEGNGVLQAFWASLKAIKAFEWLVAIGLWVTMASLLKEIDRLRAKVRMLEGRNGV